MPLCHIQNNFWGNSTDTKMVLYIQKKIISIMAGIKTRVSGRKLFRNISIFRLASEFLFSALTFVMDNMENFQTNSDTHDKRISTDEMQICQAQTSVQYHRSVCCTGIKLFLILPPTIKHLNHAMKVLQPVLMDYL
jgi:hypothetical protein